MHLCLMRKLLAFHLCLDIRESAKQTYLSDAPPNLPPWVSRRLSPAYIKAPHWGMVAYLVARHRDMSILALPLNPDIYQEHGH